MLAAEIWDALRAAATADQQTALVILDTAGIIRSSDDLSVCYDERGDAPGQTSAASPCFVRAGVLGGEGVGESFKQVASESQ